MGWLVSLLSLGGFAGQCRPGAGGHHARPLCWRAAMICGTIDALPLRSARGGNL
jgi:hypothetical protein